MIRRRVRGLQTPADEPGGTWTPALAALSGVGTIFLFYLSRLLDARSLMIKVGPRCAVRAAAACRVALLLYLVLLVYSLFRLHLRHRPAPPPPTAVRAPLPPARDEAPLRERQLLLSRVDEEAGRYGGPRAPKGMSRKKHAH